MFLCTVLGHANPTKVMLLNSYHNGLPWTDGITEVIQKELEKTDALLTVEYLDSKRHTFEEISEPMAQFLKEKYAKNPPEIVITSDDNALNFLRKHRQSLFSNAKVVFCGLNNFSEEALEGFDGRITGVIEETDPLGTIKLIQKVQPKVKRVIIVHGMTPTGEALRSFTQSEIEGQLEGLEIEWWQGLTLDELTTKSSQLGEEDAMLLLTFNRDAANNYYSYKESAKAIVTACSVPVYSLWDFYLGTGVVGGNIVTSKSQGQVAANLCKSIIEENTMRPVVKNCPHDPILIYEEIIKQGIDPKNIPVHVFILNEPIGRENDWWISITILFSLIAALTCIFYSIFFTRNLAISKHQLVKVLQSNTIAIFGTTIFGILVTFIALDFHEFHATADRTYSKLLTERKAEIKTKVDHLVDEAAITRSHFSQQIPLDDAFLQGYLTKRIYSIPKRTSTGYCFVVDTKGVIQVHPVTPEFEGVKLTAFDEQLGKEFFEAILPVVKAPAGGFVNYTWKKPGSKNPRKKLAFVRSVPDWDWVIGSGIYLDDIDADLAIILSDLKRKMMIQTFMTLLVGLGTFGFLIIIFRMTASKISKEIITLNTGILDADRDKLNFSFKILEFQSIADHANQVFDEMSYTQEKFSKSFQENTTLMALLDSETGVIIEVNRSLTETLCYKESEVVGKTFSEIGLLDEQILKDLLQSNSDDLIEIDFVDKKGAIHHAESRHQLIKIGSKYLNLLAFHDITKRKIAEKTAFLLSRAIEQCPVSVVITDTKGSIEYVNPKFCSMTGYTKEEAIGKNPRILKSGESPPELYKEMWRTITQGKQWIGEFHNKRKNGELFWESATISGVTSSEGVVSHYLAVKEDITEKKLLHAQLVQAQKLESVGQLAAGVAHEINTPIQFISDNLEFLKESIEEILSLSEKHETLISTLNENPEFENIVSDHKEAFEEADLEFAKEELPKAIDQSIDGTTRVAKIVRAMKEFSHPGSPDLSPTDINKAIQTTITVAKNEWKYVAKMETDFDESLTFVPCLVSEFNQVILNMIVNARDAIEDTKTEGLITITTSQTEGWAVIRLSDTGTGMPDEVKRRIFDPFYTTKEVGKGTGQGLAIAHDVIVNKHHGELTVESSPGKGTTFEMKLPLEKA